MTWLSTLRRIAADERGASIVEYTAVSGLALLLAGMIIVGLVNGRTTIGRQMGGILGRQVVSFEHGQGGTANQNASLTVRPPTPAIPQPAMLVLGIPAVVLAPPPVAATPINAAAVPQTAVAAPPVAAPPVAAPGVPQPPIAAPTLPQAARLTLAIPPILVPQPPIAAPSIP